MSRTSPIDNVAIGELRDELKDLNISLKESSKMSKKFTGAMFALALIQVLLAGFQLILSFVYPEDNTAREILGVFMILSTFAILVYFFRVIDSTDGKK